MSTSKLLSLSSIGQLFLAPGFSRPNVHFLSAARSLAIDIGFAVGYKTGDLEMSNSLVSEVLLSFFCVYRPYSSQWCSVCISFGLSLVLSVVI